MLKGVSAYNPADGGKNTVITNSPDLLSLENLTGLIGILFFYLYG